MVLSPNLNEGSALHVRTKVVLLISAHLPVRYLRNNAVPVGEDAHESARDAAGGMNP